MYKGNGENYTLSNVTLEKDAYDIHWICIDGNRIGEIHSDRYEKDIFYMNLCMSSCEFKYREFKVEWSPIGIFIGLEKKKDE